MNKELLILLTAATPIVELRGAIPLGLTLNLPIYEVFLLSVIGNVLPVPFILFGAKFLFERLKKIPSIENKLAQWSNKKTKKLSDQIHRWGWLGLLIFVAVPLPGTGAWTGSFAAAMLGLNFWSSLIAVICGVVVAGVLVAGIGLGVLLAI